MKNKRTPWKITGVLVLAAGAALLLSAFLLIWRNRAEDEQAGQQSQIILEDIRSVLPETPPESAEPAPDAETTALPLPGPEPSPPDREIPPVTGYAGYLEIPGLELTLPVMSDWDYDKLKIAPCRQFGSPYTDDLVIAAHNYKSHFGRLKKLTNGDAVIFTDMDGVKSTYSVTDTRIIQPTEVDAVQNSGYALVLYTCTYGGENRVAVFCSRENG